MTDITAKAHSILAGAVAASGKRAASDVASGMLARLAREGLAIVHVSQVDAVKALAGLDTILDLQNDDPEAVKDWAQQMGMDDPSFLMAAITTAREVLDGPKHAEEIAAVFANRPAA